MSSDSASRIGSDDTSNQQGSTPTTISRGQQTPVRSSSVLSSAQSSSLATVSSRRVRRNWWGHIVDSFRSISTTSRALLIMSLTMVLIQVVVTIVVLVESRGKSCDRQLRLFLIVYIIRVIIVCPVNVYMHLNPRDNRRNGQNQDENSENVRRDDTWVDKLKSGLDLFATLWFIVGNYLLFTSVTCQNTAPGLFFLSLTWVILGYIIITIPIFLCLAVIFCLPCVLVAMRVLHIGEASGIPGASTDIIQKIPLVKFKASDDSDGQNNQQSPTDTVVLVLPESQPEPSSTTSPPHEKSRLKSFFGKGSAPPPTTPQFLTIPNPDDAVCSICLSSYEDGDELRHLWCLHHFHKVCVDEWLILNRRCPMCRMDVVEMAEQHSGKKGKNRANDDDAGEGSSEGGAGR